MRASLALNRLYGRLRDLQGLYLYRYAHFVRSSPKGENCTYALRAREFSEREDDLRGLRDLLQEVLKELESYEHAPD